MKNPFSSYTKKIIKLLAEKKEPRVDDDTTEVALLDGDEISTVREAKSNNRLFYPIDLDLSEPESEIKYFCIYAITRDPEPFIEYLLYEENGVMCFPTKRPSLVKGVEKEGVKEYAGNSFIFNKISRSDKKLAKEYKWVLIDEICNHRKYQNCVISDIVYNLFINNPSMIYLYKGEQKLETPIVAFTGHEKRDNMTIALGGKNETGKFGYYYYFTNFDEVKGANHIIRYALFLKALTVNPQNDKSDNLRDKIEDPEWAGDSLYVGKIELEDGNFYRKNPLFVVKRYEQHVVLSWEKNI